MNDDVLTPDEFAKLVKLPRKTVVSMCGSGRVPGAVKFGHSWRIPRWALDVLFSRPKADAELQGTKPGDETDSGVGEGEASRAHLRGIEGGRGRVRGALASGAGVASARNPGRAEIAAAFNGKVSTVRGSKSR